jgi:hypothetical protein
MISAIVQATKPVDALPFVDLTHPSPTARHRGRLLRR